MTTAISSVAPLSLDDFYTLPELTQAVEEGYGACYDDTGNYGQILLFKEDNSNYTIQWGSDPEETRSWSHLEDHYDRLGYRIGSCCWQLVKREDLEHLKLAA